MRWNTKALIAVLLIFAVNANADLVRTRPTGGGGGVAAAVTPGTTTVTGCQNRVIYGDNSSVLNCEAEFGYATATNLLTVGSATVSTLLTIPAGSTASTGTLLGNDTDTWIGSAAAGNISFYTNNVERFRMGTGGAFTMAGSQLSFGSLAVPDLLFGREAAATFELGTDVNGAAVAQTIKAHDGITGTDVAGANLTSAGGRGTGAGQPGDRIISTGTQLATGTTAQTLVTRFHVEGGTRTLTDATATTVFTVTTGNDLSCGGTLFFTVEAADAANQQTTSGEAHFAAADNAAGAGGEACTAAVTGTNVSAATSGTLTVTADATTGTDLCNIRLTATGSLTETVGPRARYSIVFNPTSSTCAVTPQ
jgi:hypothetical protein